MSKPKSSGDKLALRPLAWLICPVMLLIVLFNLSRTLVKSVKLRDGNASNVGNGSSTKAGGCW